MLERRRLSSFIVGCLGIVLAVFKGFYYSLNYGKFTPYLMGAIHKLTERVVRLESENAMQETIRTQIGEVLTRLAALEYNAIFAFTKSIYRVIAASA